MPNPFFMRILIQAASSFGKSVFKAYQKTVKNSGAGQHAKKDNPFGEQFNKVFSSMNITTAKMTEEQAQKILSLQPEEINPNTILDAYYRMYNKNSIKNGGSFYIQSKIHNAKELLMQDFPPESEEEYRKENNIGEENKKEDDKDKKDSKKEKKEEKKEDKKEEEQKEEKKE